MVFNGNSIKHSLIYQGSPKIHIRFVMSYNLDKSHRFQARDQKMRRFPFSPALQDISNLGAENT